MTFNLLTAEQRLKNTSRWLHQGMWMLFLIAAGLMVVVRRNVPARTGSIWILGCAVLAFMLSFALRDAVRKAGHRNTEDRLVNDVKTFLERQPAVPAERPIPARSRLKQTADAQDDGLAPVRPAGFVPLQGTAAYRTTAGDPVVFDAIPSRESSAVRMEFYAVLQPVPHNC